METGEAGTVGTLLNNGPTVPGYSGCSRQLGWIRSRSWPPRPGCVRGTTL